MPYLKHEIRQQLDRNPESVFYPGELNYVITNLIIHSLGHDKCPHVWDREVVTHLIKRAVTDYAAKNGHRYATYNDIFGVLTCVALEMARRDQISEDEYRLKVLPLIRDFMLDYYQFVVEPYEEEKIKANGEVYR